MIMATAFTTSPISRPKYKPAIAASVTIKELNGGGCGPVLTRVTSSDDDNSTQVAIKVVRNALPRVILRVSSQRLRGLRMSRHILQSRFPLGDHLRRAGCRCLTNLGIAFSDSRATWPEQAEPEELQRSSWDDSLPIPSRTRPGASGASGPRPRRRG